MCVWTSIKRALPFKNDISASILLIKRFPRNKSDYLTPFRLVRCEYLLVNVRKDELSPQQAGNKFPCSLVFCVTEPTAHSFPTFTSLFFNTPGFQYQPCQYTTLISTSWEFAGRTVDRKFEETPSRTDRSKRKSQRDSMKMVIGKIYLPSV